MSDIDFLKTETNRTDIQIQNPKTHFRQFGFQKPTSAIFHVVSFTIHLLTC